jgi:DNA/RNA-binding domain of Phe-tRNA-synthetase-like protein
MAELKHGLVSAGHDLDNLVSPLRLAPSKGGEHYRNLGGVEVVLPEGDMTLAHGRGLLSSVLQGPDRETNIGSSSTNVLYTIYAPPGLPEGTLEATLDSLSSYVALFAPDALMEKRTFRDQAPARSWHQSGECFSLRSALHPRCSGSIRAWLPETYETDDGCP